MDIINEIIDSVKQNLNENTKTKTTHKICEMSVRAKSVLRRVEYAKSCFPDTILKLLTCVKDIWSHLALHMIDDQTYIKREVEFGYQQFDFLMGLYRQHTHSFAMADEDLKHALSRLKRNQNPYYDIVEIKPNKQYCFIFRIDCSALQQPLDSYLKTAFQNNRQINSTEADLHIDTTVTISNDMIKIAINIEIL